MAIVVPGRPYTGSRDVDERRYLPPAPKSRMGEWDGEELAFAQPELDLVVSPNPPRRSTGPRLDRVEFESPVAVLVPALPPVVWGEMRSSGGIGTACNPADRRPGGTGAASANATVLWPGRDRAADGETFLAGETMLVTGGRGDGDCGRLGGGKCEAGEGVEGGKGICVGSARGVGSREAVPKVIRGTPSGV